MGDGRCAQAGAPDDKPTRRGNVLWRSFWGAHQRFFRHLCMAAKVPGLVRMSNVRPCVSMVQYQIASLASHAQLL